MGKDCPCQHIDKDGTIFYHWRRIIELADKFGHEVYLDITAVDGFLPSWALPFDGPRTRFRSYMRCFTHIIYTRLERKMHLCSAAS